MDRVFTLGSVSFVLTHWDLFWATVLLLPRSINGWRKIVIPLLKKYLGNIFPYTVISGDNFMNRFPPPPPVILIICVTYIISVKYNAKEKDCARTKMYHYNHSFYWFPYDDAWSDLQCSATCLGRKVLSTKLYSPLTVFNNVSLIRLPITWL